MLWVTPVSQDLGLTSQTPESTKKEPRSEQAQDLDCTQLLDNKYLAPEPMKSDLEAMDLSILWVSSLLQKRTPRKCLVPESMTPIRVPTWKRTLVHSLEPV